MRCVVVAIAGLGLAQPALAADYGVLRGSSGYEVPIKYRNWEGFYVGGHVGTGGGGANFSQSGSPLIGEHDRQYEPGEHRRSKLGNGRQGGHRTGAAVRRLRGLQLAMGRRRSRPGGELLSHQAARQFERSDRPTVASFGA